MKIYSSYYAMLRRIIKGGGVPVGISLGSPKGFADNYTVLDDLAPEPQMLSQYKAGTLSVDHFTAWYNEKLNHIDFNLICFRLSALDHDGRPLVLLCWEGLRGITKDSPRPFCHRHLVLDFLAKQAFFRGSVRGEITKWPGNKI